MWKAAKIQISSKKKGKKYTCADVKANLSGKNLKKFCKKKHKPKKGAKIKGVDACPVTCGECTPAPTGTPTMYPGACEDISSMKWKSPKKLKPKYKELTCNSLGDEKSSTRDKICTDHYAKVNNEKISIEDICRETCGKCPFLCRDTGVEWSWDKSKPLYNSLKCKTLSKLGDDEKGLICAQHFFKIGKEKHYIKDKCRVTCDNCPITPTGAPTDSPSGAPSVAPSGAPTDFPSGAPSDAPTDTPTESRTYSPTSTLVPKSSLSLVQVDSYPPTSTPTEICQDMDDFEATDVMVEDLTYDSVSCVSVNQLSEGESKRLCKTRVDWKSHTQTKIMLFCPSACGQC
uniref:Uncharacterized protein n=1 Tax=Corethron hystrix TaxID=216773 RepID=A0A6U5DJR5_9STRA|mmetsp:Transcript_1256/g.2548  ORF Transcript_1256/g.2548 Transcript_1256/m.2548 type:complete len:344 (+) Transcript_1256:225-1256(+)